MPAPKGNKYWKLRDADGRRKLFESPETLLNECYDYFEWCNENPIYSYDVVRGGELAGTELKIKHDKPYSIDGLCVYLGITYQTFSNYEKEDSYKDFFEVISHVREIIRENQVSGAIVGKFNSSIVARINNISDSSKVDHSSKDGTMTPPKIQFFNSEDVDAKD